MQDDGALSAVGAAQKTVKCLTMKEAISGAWRQLRATASLASAVIFAMGGLSSPAQHPVQAGALKANSYH